MGFTPTASGTPVVVPLRAVGCLELGSERQQRNRAGLLDRPRQLALERRARARQAARNDLAAVGHKLLQQPHVAVADRVDLLHRKLADLLAAEELPSARTTGAGRTRRTRRPRTARARSTLALISRTRRRRGAFTRCCLIHNFISHVVFPLSAAGLLALSRFCCPRSRPSGGLWTRPSPSGNDHGSFAQRFSCPLD
jgi:hypothetical protein